MDEGFGQSVDIYSDFNVSLETFYYDQYVSGSFLSSAKSLMELSPDAVILSPTVEEETSVFVAQLQECGIPYVFIDSNVPHLNPLAFYGQHAGRSGYFAARILKLLAYDIKEIVVFRQINEGRLGSNQQLYREDGFYLYM